MDGGLLKTKLGAARRERRRPEEASTSPNLTLGAAQGADLRSRVVMRTEPRRVGRDLHLADWICPAKDHIRFSYEKVFEIVLYEGRGACGTRRPEEPAVKWTVSVGRFRSEHRPLEGATGFLLANGGPLALLDWIEGQLGMNGPKAPWTDRVIVYHQALRRATNAVFAQSFQADPWATASHLLKRRDALLLAGWDPSQRTAVRIVDDLACLEPIVEPPGVPDRIQACLEALATGLRLPDHGVVIDEIIEEWPPLWQRLLRELSVEVIPRPEIRGRGALRVIQTNLVDNEEDEATVDPSLTAIQASSRHAAVGLVSRLLRERKATVCTPDPGLGLMLDAALHADGQPTVGALRESRGQPVHQVLPLVMELLWEPVNPYVLLDLLLLPVGPLRAYAYKLTRALEEQPGYGSDAWNNAIEAIRADDEEGKHTQRLKKWLEHERIAVGETVPTSLVEARCGLVAQWAAGRAQHEGKRNAPDEILIAALRSAASQARALGNLVLQLGATISEAQLKRLLDEVRGQARIDIPHETQANGSGIVASLADVPDTDLLIWLAPNATQRPGHGFTPREVRQLADQGILLDVGDRRSAEIKGLARAEGLLVVEVPDEKPKDPLWLQIHGALLISGRRGDALPHLEDILRELIPTRSVHPVNFPMERVAWDKAAPVPLPEHTSASALEDQLSCPLRWTLRHALNLRYGAISSIPEDFRLKGLLAHTLMECVFSPGEPPSPEQAEQRMRDAFDELLPRNAAPLAIPRKIQERNRLRGELAASARQFATILTEGGYRIVGMEVPVEGEVDGVPLAGRIDCVIADDNEEAIVDLKLAGARFENLIEEGRALQLATYAHSRGARSGGYFILAKGSLFTPSAAPVRGGPRTIEGPDLGETWERLEQALRNASPWMMEGPVVARPLQDPAAWEHGTNVALDAEAAEHVLCKYCDYDILCGRRPLA